MPSLVFLILTVIVSLIVIKMKGYQSKEQVAETFLSYLLLFNVGCMGLLAFYAHVFNADQTAQNIGWGTGSPFQFEMGMTNLAIGVAGILSIGIGGYFGWLPLPLWRFYIGDALSDMQ